MSYKEKYEELKAERENLIKHLDSCYNIARVVKQSETKEYLLGKETGKEQSYKSILDGLNNGFFK